MGKSKANKAAKIIQEGEILAAIGRTLEPFKLYEQQRILLSVMAANGMLDSDYGIVPPAPRKRKAKR